MVLGQLTMGDKMKLGLQCMSHTHKNSGRDQNQIFLNTIFFLHGHGKHCYDMGWKMSSLKTTKMHSLYRTNNQKILIEIYIYQVIINSGEKNQATDWEKIFKTLYIYQI